MEQQPSRLYELLSHCTIKLAIPGGHGTGFFVAPGMILTCAHVVKEAYQSGSSPVPVKWNGQSYSAQITKYFYDPDGYLDLALLQVPLSDHPCVLLSEDFSPSDECYTYGYTDDYSDGEASTFELEGPSNKRGGLFIKFKAGQVRPGLSGAPLLNMRTAAVCGLIKSSRDRDRDMGGRAIAVSTVFQVLPDLANQQQLFHSQDHRWRDCLKTQGARPTNLIPERSNPLFQTRPGEFEQLEAMLFGPDTLPEPRRLGIVGMAGVGKSQLTIQLAKRYQQHFPDGIFWMLATGKDLLDWQSRFANLADVTGYLPPNHDPSRPENEANRARHFYHYLVTHKNALLILDNVEDPQLVADLPKLTGNELACTVLYTSRIRRAPLGIAAYEVKQLPEEGALRLLLSETREALLTEILEGSKNTEAEEARKVCRGVRYLPIALIHLHGLLKDDPLITLERLARRLEQRGVLELANKQREPLFEIFRCSWELLDDEKAQQVFKLASYFSEAEPISFWLLGLASGLGNGQDSLDPLGDACLQLQKLSLLEIFSADQVQLHPLVREFGQRLIKEDEDGGISLREEASKRLADEFIDLSRLEELARQQGYWECLKQTRAVLQYLGRLQATNREEQVRQIEQWLDRESYLLADERWWPTRIPNLFYQQMFNRAVEAGLDLQPEGTTRCWLRQTRPINAESRELLRTFARHTGEIECVAFSPDGSKILTGSEDGTARLWETSTGRELRCLEGHTDTVTSVAFSPDGLHVLTGSNDQTVRIWEISSGRELRCLEGHTHWVTDVAFSPNGEQIFTSSWDGTARLWETSTGHQLLSLGKHTGWISKAERTPRFSEMILVRSIEELLRTLNEPKETVEDDSHTAPSPDEDQVTELDLSPEGDQITCVAFSPDGQKVLTGSSDQTARLWDINSGHELLCLKGHTHSVVSVAFSPDGQKILTGSYDHTARLWDINDGHELLCLTGHTRSVLDVAFSPDGQAVLTCSDDDTARLWNISNGRERLLLEGHTGWVRSVSFSPDGKQILTGSADQTARLWKTPAAPQQPHQQGHTSTICGVAFSPNGQTVLTGSHDHTARIWDINSGRELRCLKHTDSVESVAFSPDGQKVLTGSYDQAARLWDIRSERELLCFRGHGHRVTSVAFSPNGRKVLTGSLDHTTRVWETRYGREVLRLGLGTHTCWAGNAAFSPDGNLVLTGSADGTVQLWDAQHGRELLHLGRHNSLRPWVVNVVFSPDGNLALAGSEDGTVRLWEINYGYELLHLSGTLVGSTPFSPDSSLVLISSGSFILLWRILPLTDVGLVGIYNAHCHVKAVYWEDNTHIVLADVGGPQGRPHYYHLTLEGMYGVENNVTSQELPPGFLPQRPAVTPGQIPSERSSLRGILQKIRRFLV